jgi:hypothetical protein
MTTEERLEHTKLILDVISTVLIRADFSGNQDFDKFADILTQAIRDHQRMIDVIEGEN